MRLSEAPDIPRSLVDTFELTLSRGMDLSTLNDQNAIFDLEFPTFAQAYERAGGASASDSSIMAEAFVSPDIV